MVENIKERFKEFMELSDLITEKETQLNKLKDECSVVEEEMNLLKIKKAKLQAEVEVDL